MYYYHIIYYGDICIFYMALYPTNYSIYRARLVINYSLQLQQPLEETLCLNLDSLTQSQLKLWTVFSSDRTAPRRVRVACSVTQSSVTYSPIAISRFLGCTSECRNIAMERRGTIMALVRLSITCDLQHHTNLVSRTVQID